MKIDNVGIKNFRPLKDVSIRFDDVTTLIGPNGAGKSAVLRALDWFFNGSKSGDLNDHDCCNGDIENDIEVEVTFSDLTDSDRESLGKYTPAGATTFTAWKKRTPAGEEYLSANAKGFPAFRPIKEATNVAEKKEKYRLLREARPDLNLPVANTGPIIDTAITEWEAAHVGDLEDMPESLQTNFFGFNSAGKMSGLFDFVFITADLRASEETLDVKNSIIGRILERTVDRSIADAEVATIVEQSRVAQQTIYQEKFGDQLNRTAEELSRVVDSYSPGRSIKVFPSEIELKAPKTTFNVAIVDGDAETAIERQGHGFQRTLLISALQLLALYGSASEDGVFCLAIEEPELFQHPIQAQAFAKVLRGLTQDEEKKIQVMYATHSPYFVDGCQFDQIRRLTRDTNGTHDVIIESSTMEDVKRDLDGIVAPDVIERQLKEILLGQLSDAIFSKGVIVVEGQTEVAVLQGIAERSGNLLEVHGISVVGVGGKTNIALVHSILKSLGIPTYAIFDGDRGCEAKSRAMGKAEAKIADEVANHKKQNRDLMTYFGLEPVDFPDETETEAVTILEDNLEALMQRDWPEWISACELVESELQINLRKNNAGYKRATLIAEGASCPLLERVIEKMI